MQFLLNIGRLGLAVVAVWMITGSYELSAETGLGIVPAQAERLKTGVGNSAELPTQQAATPTPLVDAPQPTLEAQMRMESISNSRALMDFVGMHFQAGVHKKTVAGRYEKYILPEETAQKLDWKGRLGMSLKEETTLWTLAGPLASATYSHLVQSDPRYGSDSAGFGERVGAAMLRNASQAIFTDGIGGTVFHEDTRYYVKGNGEMIPRIWYAATRVLVAKNMDGGDTLNLAQISGYGGAALLTRTYYPAVSADWSSTMSAWGAGLGGAALSNIVHEFAPDVFRVVKRKTHFLD